MSIRGGQILHYAGGFLIDRIQSAGPSNLNLNEEKVYELGNAESVETTRDVPDTSFYMESFDCTTEVEALLCNVDPTTVIAGDDFDFRNHVPIDVASPWKGSLATFTSVAGIAVPYLTLESATYRFGVEANAAQQFTLRGDHVFFVDGTPYNQSFAEAGTGPYTFDHTALKTVLSGDDVYALCVTIVETDGTYTRLFHGDDYTDDANGFTLLAAPPAGCTIKTLYGSATTLNVPQATHPLSSVKPGALRGRDIDVLVSDGAATPALVKWTGITSVEVNWRVTLEKETELGNPNTVTQDYDVPEVSGTITFRPRNVDHWMEIIQQITGTPAGEIANVLSFQSLPLEIRLNHPSTGVRMKTLYVEDARFSPPPPQGRVQQRLEVQIPFTSDGGNLVVYDVARP